MMDYKKIKKKTILNNGFTLIEVMVALSIFALVMVVAMGSILSIVAANKKAQAFNSVINNLNFSLESMMRDLRTGYDYSCENVGDCSEGGESITFKSSQHASGLNDASVTYGLSGSSIYRNIEGEIYNLTADEIEIQTLKFYVVDTDTVGEGNYNQPKILIIVKGQAGPEGNKTSFSLQTVVSQRRLDI